MLFLPALFICSQLTRPQNGVFDSMPIGGVTLEAALEGTEAVA
jgi:hypothetical protein